MARVLGGSGRGGSGFQLPADLAIVGTVLCSKMINRSGGSLEVGTYLLPGSGDLEVVVGTSSRKCIGTVAMLSPNDGDDVWVTATRFPVLCNSRAVAVGDYLDASRTPGQGDPARFPFPGTFAIAVTAKTAGNPGVVQAMLSVAELY